MPERLRFSLDRDEVRVARMALRPSERWLRLFDSGLSMDCSGGGSLSIQACDAEDLADEMLSRIYAVGTNRFEEMTEDGLVLDELIYRLSNQIEMK